jgi:hypothetical protein
MIKGAASGIEDVAQPLIASIAAAARIRIIGPGISDLHDGFVALSPAALRRGAADH